MTHEQLEERVLKNERTLAVFDESLKSAHKRIDESVALIGQIHKLTTSIETLALQVEMQGNRQEEILRSQKEQGERIGALAEKPARRWEAVTAQIVGLIVAALFGAVAVKFM